MSIHKSLKQKSTMTGTRSVLSRWERMNTLKEQGRWKDGDKVTGLPKVRTKWRVRKKKKDAAPAAPAAGAKAAAAAPAAGAKAAAAPAAKPDAKKK
jgi:small basic protein (TIGR04137 family)